MVTSGKVPSPAHGCLRRHRSGDQIVVLVFVHELVEHREIIDLDLADGVWALFDPSGLLPRDPATLILDTKGTATLTRDLVDDSVTDSTPPGLLNSLDLTQLLLRLAGAEVTAQGGFTFDNSDKTTFPGMPLPTGKMELQLGDILILAGNKHAIDHWLETL